MDDGANAAFYKKPGVTAGDILAGTVTTDDDSARRFLAAVSTSTASAAPQRTASTAGTAPHAGAPSAVTAVAPAGQGTSGAAQTFPLADPQPGKEPK